MGFLSSIFGSTILAGYLRTALLGGIATLAQSGKLPGGVDYAGLIDGFTALAIGLWQHAAKAHDPSVSTASATVIKAAAIAKGMSGAHNMSPVATRAAGDE